MSQNQGKFSPLTIKVKEQIRRFRLLAGYSMADGARLLGVSRKQLEDIETTRDYGCHIDLELLAKIKVVYRQSVDEMLGELPDDPYSGYYTRKSQKKVPDLTVEARPSS